MIKSIFKIYLSHALAGPKGKDATDDDIWENVFTYRKIGEEIKAYLIDWEKMDGLPKSYLYVPADHEEFVFNARIMKYVTVPEILKVDCAIVHTCSLLIAFGDHTQSGGMQVEIEYAKDEEIPIYFMPNLQSYSIKALKYVIKQILKGDR